MRNWRATLIDSSAGQLRKIFLGCYSFLAWWLYYFWNFSLPARQSNRTQCIYCSTTHVLAWLVILWANGDRNESCIQTHTTHDALVYSAQHFPLGRSQPGCRVVGERRWSPAFFRSDLIWTADSVEEEAKMEGRRSNRVFPRSESFIEAPVPNPFEYQMKLSTWEKIQVRRRNGPIAVVEKTNTH